MNKHDSRCLMYTTPNTVRDVHKKRTVGRGEGRTAVLHDF
jgi:hypothetical protein